jgi:hypothetical protein
MYVVHSFTKLEGVKPRKTRIFPSIAQSGTAYQTERGKSREQNSRDRNRNIRCNRERSKDEGGTPASLRIRTKSLENRRAAKIIPSRTRCIERRKEKEEGKTQGKPARRHLYPDKPVEPRAAFCQGEAHTCGHNVVRISDVTASSLPCSCHPPTTR